ncbi:MAG: HAMP domain-containing histidine kinase [Oscillospiraceae bacterium]|nr:HAMP domain-containing histidine kinase [Oscillospiraceae bacterium]
MIKRLKKRFTAVLSGSLSIIMLIICAVIYVSMYRAQRDTMDMTVDHAMNSPFEMRNEANDGTAEPAVTDSASDTDEQHEPPSMKPSQRHEGEDFSRSVRGDRAGYIPFDRSNRISTGWVKIRLDKDGNVKSVYLSQRNSDTEDFPSDLAEEAARYILSSGKTDGNIIVGDVHYRYSYSGERRAIVLIDRQDMIHTLRRLLIVLASIYIYAVGLFIFISMMLARWVARPIEDAWNRQTEFFSNASHELKTPLAVITANLDAAVSQPEKTVREQTRWFDIIRDEAAKMSGLISEMLYLSREEYKTETVMTEFDLSYESEKACLAAEALCFENGKELVTDISSGIWVRGEKESLDRVVHILIDNAVRHSPAGSEIKVALSGGKKCCFSVENEGVIEADDLDRIFDRYYRTDRSRSRDTGGFGLGLAIAKAVAVKHGGDISASSGGGRTVFTVHLPTVKHDTKNKIGTDRT